MTHQWAARDAASVHVRVSITRMDILTGFCMQGSELPVTINSQSAADADLCSASSTEPESGTDEKLSMCQATTQTSQESQLFVTATSKHPSLTVAAHSGDYTVLKSDSQISSESGQKTRSLAGTDVSVQRESVHRRSSVSAVHSQTSSSNTSRSVTTTHGRKSYSSSERDRPALQDRSSDCSRRSLSSHVQSGSGQRCRENTSQQCDKGSSERLRYRPESVSGTSCNREVQRLGHRDDLVSRREREHEWELRKYQSSHRRQASRRERREHGASSMDKVDEPKSEDLSRFSGRERKVADDLSRLSMDATRTKEKECAEVEYQPVLTRHVNQLFVRGDNVALVAILD